VSIRKRRLFPILSLAALVTSAGCGPFGYLKKVAVDASRAVADAEKAGAEKYAPYEYWGAVSYLEQAKVMMAYSEYERSFDYGERAKQLAQEAKQKAERRESGKMQERIDDAPADADADAPGAGEASGAASGEAEGGDGNVKVKGKIGAGAGGGR
jgi:hypothetical protein